jgi:hypothetical protein
LTRGVASFNGKNNGNIHAVLTERKRKGRKKRKWDGFK